MKITYVLVQKHRTLTLKLDAQHLKFFLGPLVARER
jgi:hypothetical protein